MNLQLQPLNPSASNPRQALNPLESLINFHRILQASPVEKVTQIARFVSDGFGFERAKSASDVLDPL